MICVKFGLNQTSGFGEEVKNEKRMNDRRTDRQTDERLTKIDQKSLLKLTA